MTLLDNLLAYYKLDGDATDATKRADGVATGVTWQAGKIGNGAKFAGTTSSNIVVTNTLQNVTSLSVAMWVKPTNLTSTEKYFSRDQGGTTNWGFMLSQDSTNVYQIGAQVTGSLFKTVNSTTSVQTSNFVLLGLTYDGGTLRIWVNASNENSLVVNLAMMDTTAKNIFIGCLNTTTQTSAALIDEVGFWGRELVQADWTKLYNNTAGLAFPFSSPFPTLQSSVTSPSMQLIRKVVAY